MSEFASGPRTELQEKLPVLSLKKETQSEATTKTGSNLELDHYSFLFLAKCFVLL